jgi:hypothetical protein
VEMGTSGCGSLEQKAGRGKGDYRSCRLEQATQGKASRAPKGAPAERKSAKDQPPAPQGQAKEPAPKPENGYAQGAPKPAGGGPKSSLRSHSGRPEGQASFNSKLIMAKSAE